MSDKFRRRSDTMMTLTTTALLLFCSASSQAVVVHPEDDPPTGLSAPNSNVVGRWAGNASAVAIGPNHILTTRHQGAGVGVAVNFGGTNYFAVEQTLFGSADLRLVRIAQDVGDTTPANLTQFVDLYTHNDEVGQVVVIGGFGKGRGAALQTGGLVDYGYLWSGADNTAQRFGANLVEGAANVIAGSLTSNTLVIDFDDIGTGGYTDFEAAVAKFDSGGGWFINDAGQWKLAALSAYADDDTPSGQTNFRDSVTGLPNPDLNYGVRISPLAGGIFAAIPEPASLVILLGVGALLGCRRR